MKINLTPEQVGYLREVVRRDIQTFYADPFGCLGEDPEPADVLKEIDLLSGLTRALGLDFDHIVRANVPEVDVVNIHDLTEAPLEPLPPWGVIPDDDDPKAPEA